MPVADRMKQPQLFGRTRGAAQARRAAGLYMEGDPIQFVEDNRKTRWGSARKLVRSIARHRGVMSMHLSKVSRLFTKRRHKALGTKPLAPKFRHITIKASSAAVEHVGILASVRLKARNFVGKLFGRGAGRGRA